MVGAVSLLAHLTSISNFSLAPDSQTLYHTAEEGYEGLSPKSSAGQPFHHQRIQFHASLPFSPHKPPGPSPVRNKPTLYSSLFLLRFPLPAQNFFRFSTGFIPDHCRVILSERLLCHSERSEESYHKKAGLRRARPCEYVLLIRTDGSSRSSRRHGSSVP